MKRLLKSLLAIAVIVTTLAGFVCSKNELLNNAGLVISSFRLAAPLLNQFLPGSAAKLEAVIPIAEKLRQAVAANDATNAIDCLRQLLPVFSDIVENDVHGLPIATQTKILAALALADIALSFLANHYSSNPALAATRARAAPNDPITEFAKKEVWGHAYKH